MIKQEDYIAMLKRNPKLRSSKQNKTGSALEEKFLSIWRTLNGPDLLREYRFHPVRKWKFDFVHVKSSTAIEVNGGLWIKSGHSTGSGIGRDYEKANAAILCGYQLFQLSSDMLNARYVLDIIEFIEKKQRFMNNAI